jgi:hypothetical protein
VALAWTEAITNIQQGHASEEDYVEVRSQFDEAEVVKLTLAITQININPRATFPLETRAQRTDLRARLAFRLVRNRTNLPCRVRGCL